MNLASELCKSNQHKLKIQSCEFGNPTKSNQQKS